MNTRFCTHLVLFTSLVLVATTAIACPPGYLELKTEHVGTGCVMGTPVLVDRPVRRPRRPATIVTGTEKPRVQVIDRAQSSYDAQTLVREIERVSRNQHIRYR